MVDHDEQNLPPNFRIPGPTPETIEWLEHEHVAIAIDANAQQSNKQTECVGEAECDIERAEHRSSE